MPGDSAECGGDSARKEHYRTPMIWVCRQPVTVERSLTQVFLKNRTDFDAPGDTTIARGPVCFQHPGKLPFRQF